MCVANWASTTRSQKSADWLAILRNQAPNSQNTRQMTPRMMTGHPIKVWSLSTTASKRLQERQGIDDQEEEEKDRPQRQQSLGGRARGIDDRGAQAVEKDRRRQRPLQVGEEVDDVEPALDQVTQIVGGQRHRFGGAFLAVGDQVAESPAAGGSRARSSNRR